jgi:hypothetical protein
LHLTDPSLFDALRAKEWAHVQQAARVWDAQAGAWAGEAASAEGAAEAEAEAQGPQVPLHLTDPSLFDALRAKEWAHVQQAASVWDAQAGAWAGEAASAEGAAEAEGEEPQLAWQLTDPSLIDARWSKYRAHVQQAARVWDAQAGAWAGEAASAEGAAEAEVEEPQVPLHLTDPSLIDALRAKRCAHVQQAARIWDPTLADWAALRGSSGSHAPTELVAVARSAQPLRPRGDSSAPTGTAAAERVADMMEEQSRRIWDAEAGEWAAAPRVAPLAPEARRVRVQMPALMPAKPMPALQEHIDCEPPLRPMSPTRPEDSAHRERGDAAVVARPDAARSLAGLSIPPLVDKEILVPASIWGDNASEGVTQRVTVVGSALHDVGRAAHWVQYEHEGQTHRVWLPDFSLATWLQA